MDDVFAYIDQHRTRFVDELCVLLRQPSVSTQNRGVRECAELVRNQMADAGLDARLLPTPGYPVVFGTAGDARRTVLMYGHYDVQPPEPLEAWDTPPFEPSLRNRRIYARGAGDNKGQLEPEETGKTSPPPDQPKSSLFPPREVGPVWERCFKWVDSM